MAEKEDLVELIRWKTDRIASTTVRFGNIWDRHISKDHTGWVDFRNGQLLPTIKTRSSLPVTYKGEGFYFTFSWPAISRMEGQEFTTWHEEEPRIRFEGRAIKRDLLQAVAHTMENDHGLEVNYNPDLNPLLFTFPKYLYAVELGVERVIDLSYATST